MIVWMTVQLHDQAKNAIGAGGKKLVAITGFYLLQRIHDLRVVVYGKGPYGAKRMHNGIPRERNSSGWNGQCALRINYRRANA